MRQEKFRERTKVIITIYSPGTPGCMNMEERKMDKITVFIDTETLTEEELKEEMKEEKENVTKR